MDFQTFSLKVARRFVGLFIKKKNPWNWPSNIERTESNMMMYNLLLRDEPCLIGRVGTSEAAVVRNFMSLATSWSFNRVRKSIGYIFHKNALPYWDKYGPYIWITRNAGVFARGGVTNCMLADFAELYLHYIPQMDICARWGLHDEGIPYNEKSDMVQLESMYPFFVENPWTRVLKNKKVLVVHPYKATIESQYRIREKLFPNLDILPTFELKAISAVQSIGGTETRFNDWFEALKYMEDEISKVDFDIALLGCGAYGLPLAGYIKEKLGKKAVHLGVGLQLLFGIKGRRWEKGYTNPCYRNLFNEYWVYPSDSEKPKNFNQIENGCYW